jgi:hypothetical protein
MKKKIAILRLVGVITLIAFMVSLFTRTSPEEIGRFSDLQKLLMFISFASFGMVILMQLYLFYFKSYYRQEHEDDQE